MDLSFQAQELKKRLSFLHEPPLHSAGHLLAGIVHGVLIAACIAAWMSGYWPVSVLLWIAIAWMDHAALSRLHEAAHRMLFRSRVANELTGIVIGTFALTPLSVYRYVHSQHHAHLGRERDPEFWPYNLPDSPRPVRLVYAWLELAAGWIFTPMLYSIRTAQAWPSLARTLQGRLFLEWLFLLGLWTVLLVVIEITGTWTWFLIGHLVPTWIAGTVQTIRKFTEHVGMFGDTILDMTRTVVYTHPISQAASRSQLHVEHHGTHHRWPGIPYHRLPEATAIIYGDSQPGPTYSSHWAAIRDMLPHLLNPRVGPQWNAGSATGSDSA